LSAFELAWQLAIPIALLHLFLVPKQKKATYEKGEGEGMEGLQNWFYYFL
jgi:hypothetical protein